MSIESVQKFLSQVAEDQALQEQLVVAMNAEDDREAVTTLAQSKGFEFTSDELAQEIQNRQSEIQRRQEAGELSDEELEAVAGGEFVVSAVTIATITVIASGAASIATGIITANGLPKVKW